MLVDVAGKLIVVATADKGEAKNFAQGMAFDNTAVRVHTTDAINITATAAAGTWQGAQGIEGNNNDLEFVSDAGGITVTALGGNSTNLQKEYAVWLYDSSLTLDAKDAEAGIELNGDVEVVTNKTSNSTLNLKSNTKVDGNVSDISGSSKGTLNITGTTMNLTDNLKTLTVADKTTLKGSTVYFYDENNQADKYNTADYRTITTNDLDASGTNEFLCVPMPTAFTVSRQATIKLFPLILLPAKVPIISPYLTRECATAITMPPAQQIKAI